MPKLVPFTKDHNNGKLWAKGLVDSQGLMQGKWRWFRKDGSLLRSGEFEDSQQRGEWITYDSKGEPYKITNFPNIGSDLPITSGPAQRALNEANINSLADLQSWDFKELAKLHGMGPKAIKILQNSLKDRQ